MSSEFEINDNGRTCTTCRKFLPWNNFYKDKRSCRGFKPNCKTCFQEETKRREAAQKPEIELAKPQRGALFSDFVYFRTHTKEAA